MMLLQSGTVGAVFPGGHQGKEASRARKLLYFIIALLLLPALFINLGEMVFIDDEGIRSLVAQEMMWRGEYLVPSLHGDVYLNKPPLYNWLLIFNFKFWGEVNEWTARFPTVTALFGFAITAFFVGRRPLGDRLAFIFAFTVITCGRMLFWDSMLGLIDVTFSWIVFGQITWLCYFVSQKKWWSAFLPAYLLCSIGFLLKGLPAITFTGFSIIGLLIWHKSFKKLFGIAHILSGLLSLVILAAYYLPLSQELDISLVFQRLFVESGKRTAVNYAWTETVGHLVAFPFEMLYHFLPWTLLVIFLWRHDLWPQLRNKPIVGGWMIALLANLPLYWLSPNVYPRYLLMLFPLLFGVGLYFYQLATIEYRKRVLRFHYGISGLMIVFGVAILFVPLHPDTIIVEYRWWWSIGCFTVFLFVIWLGKKEQENYSWRSVNTDSTVGNIAGFLRQPLLSFVAVLLLLRVVFNIFVLPPRAAGDERGQRLKLEAKNLGYQFKQSGESLAIFGYTKMEPASSFYLEQTYGGIVPRHFDQLEATTTYILNPLQYEYAYYKSFGGPKLYMRHEEVDYRVVQLRSTTLSTDFPERLMLDGMGTGIPLVR